MLYKLLSKCAIVCLFFFILTGVSMGADDDFEILNANPSFEDGLTSWGQYLNAAAGAVFNTDKDAADGDRSAYIEVTKVSGTNWHVGLTQDLLTLEANEVYTVDFFAKADVNRIINLEMKRSPGLGDWEGISGQDINITTEWAEYFYTFTCLKDYDQGAFLGFWLGQVTGEVWIDGVRLYWGEKQDREDTVPQISVDANGKLVTRWAAIKSVY